MSYYSSIKLISDFLKKPLNENVIDFTTTYHQIAQSYCKWPIAIQNENSTELVTYEWGIITDYMNTPEKIKQYRSKLVNARSEKIFNDAGSVWHSLKTNRCLVFCNGFFEHKQVGSKKLPFYISPKNDALFCFAGLFNNTSNNNTFTVITTKANSLMAEIHNSGNEKRMPLILNTELALKWIDDNNNESVYKDILSFSYEDEKMQAWQVAPIRKSKVDNEQVIAPIENIQTSLF